MTLNPDGKTVTRSYRRYSHLVIILIILPVLLLGLAGTFFFQPYWGPLTRIAGLLENDYGWNNPQEAFDEPLFNLANGIDGYDRYYDMVVVGDSFSYDERKGWQNYFVAKTGVSVVTLSHDIGLERIINSEMFRSNPPRFLVFESLEQYSLARLHKYKSLPVLENVVGESPQSTPSEDMAGVMVSPRLVGRDVSPPLGSNAVTPLESRIGQTLNYLQKALARRFSRELTAPELRSLWGSNLENAAFLLPIRDDAGSLFSSKLKDRLLVYSRDIGKITDESVVKQAAVSAWQMKHAIEANGRTRVFMMLFPDKLTIYAPYLVDPSVAPPSIIPTLAREYPYQLRLDEVFAQAVADGVQDLYLPDDTHCGYMGYQMAAEQLVLAITQDEKQLYIADK
jgi:hypothetical protein